MLKLGEKIVYQSTSDFEVGNIGRLGIGDKTISITNLGNIIIEDKANLFKKEDVKYYYSYSSNKLKLKFKFEGSFIVMYSESLPFNIISDSSQGEIKEWKLSVKLSFEQFRDIYINQREFIADFENNKCLFKLDNENLSIGWIDEDSEKITFSDGYTSFDIYLNDIENLKKDNKEIYLQGYFYIEDKDEIIRNLYIFTDKDFNSKLEEIVQQNKKIGDLPEDSHIAYANLYGTIEDDDYNNLEVFIVKYGNKVSFINKRNKSVIISTTTEECLKLTIEDYIILYDKKNIFSIKTSDRNIELLQLEELKDIESENIGFTENYRPFFIKHTESNLTIYKSRRKPILSINNNDIKDVEINNTSRKVNDKFTEIKIIFGRSRLVINLRSELIRKLIRNIFIYTKKPMIKNIPIQNLYMNWAKGTNDLILFNFFGNLYYMKMEIDNILSREINDEDRINIVNMIYYQIQNQREQFDILSAYMPNAIEQGEIRLFKEFGIPLDKKLFRILQKQLFSLAGQINRHLAEIEKNLSQLSFVIYNQFNTRDFANKVKNKQIGIGVAASVASSVILGGGLAFPFLAMQGMNFYTNKKMDEKNKEIESSKLNLFTDQAISKLYHLVDVMYPYYISEANENLYELFNMLGKQYSKHNDERVKEILFNRIADIYVSKQMTLNNMTNLRKKDLIDRLYDSIGSSINTFDANMFLTGGIN